MIFIIKQMSLH